MYYDKGEQLDSHFALLPVEFVLDSQEKSL